MDRLALDVNCCFDAAAGGLGRADLVAVSAAAKGAYDAFVSGPRAGKSVKAVATSTEAAAAETETEESR